MKSILATALLISAGTASWAEAENHPIVVELFTSQGCYSCPTADAYLTELAAENDDIIALALHVDYWDYLGWNDIFAQPEFTERQATYNVKLKSRYRLVTPQMVFQGQSHVAGAMTDQIDAAVAKARDVPQDVSVSLAKSDGAVQVDLTPSGGSGSKSGIFLVNFIPEQDVDIKRGENAGKKITYTHIVSSWSKIGTWDGQGDLSFRHELTSEEPFVVIVQAEGTGQILGAQKISY